MSIENQQNTETTTIETDNSDVLKVTIETVMDDTPNDVNIEKIVPVSDAAITHDLPEEEKMIDVAGEINFVQVDEIQSSKINGADVDNEKFVEKIDHAPEPTSKSNGADVNSEKVSEMESNKSTETIPLMESSEEKIGSHGEDFVEKIPNTLTAEEKVEPVSRIPVSKEKVNRRQTFQTLPKDTKFEYTEKAAPATLEDNRFLSKKFSFLRKNNHLPKEINIKKPLERTAADGPVVSQNEITAPVRATNPLLEEVLHAIDLLEQNDESLIELDLKDCPVFTEKIGTAIATALLKNDKLKKLNLANTGFNTLNSQQLAEALRENKGIEILNLEGNQIAPVGIRALADMLAYNNTLMELKLNQQRSPAGTDAEQSFAKALAKNETFIKLSLVIRDVASRNQIDRFISRNKDIARKKRNALKKLAQ